MMRRWFQSFMVQYDHQTVCVCLLFFSLVGSESIRRGSRTVLGVGKGWAGRLQPRRCGGVGAFHIRGPRQDFRNMTGVRNAARHHARDHDRRRNLCGLVVRGQMSVPSACSKIQRSPSAPSAGRSAGRVRRGLRGLCAGAVFLLWRGHRELCPTVCGIIRISLGLSFERQQVSQVGVALAPFASPINIVRCRMSTCFRDTSTAS